MLVNHQYLCFSVTPPLPPFVIASQFLSEWWELLFCAKLDRFFSAIKTHQILSIRKSFGALSVYFTRRCSNFVYDVMPAIKLWADDKYKWLEQSLRSKKCKKRKNQKIGSISVSIALQACIHVFMKICSEMTMVKIFIFCFVNLEFRLMVIELR